MLSCTGRINAVAQLVEALRCKPEGRGFDSRWCHLTFFRPHYGPGIESASNRNECQEYFLGGKCGRCVGLIALLPSCADCFEIWEPHPPGNLRACPGLYRDCFTSYRTYQGLMFQRVLLEHTSRCLASQTVPTLY
jgi:hypothetical protein